MNQSELTSHCQHCKKEIYRDIKGHWRHIKFVSWCRTKAVGPDQSCWCGRNHNKSRVENKEIKKK